MIKGVPTAVSFETKVSPKSVMEYDSRKYDQRRKVVIGLSVGIIVIIVVPIVLWSMFGVINYQHISTFKHDD